MYGENWSDVVRESHFIVQDIGECLNARTRVVAADAVFWAGPRIAMRDALRSLGFAAVGGAAASVTSLIFQPLLNPQIILAVYGIAFAIVFFPGFLIIALTK